jgi:SAM-dependent methyltransferase
LVGDGARLPLRDASADLVCCAQSWHWLDPNARVAETHRVLGGGGRLAAWWSQTRADGEAWFDDYCAAVEAATDGGVRREQRDTDWGATIAVDGRFDVGDRIDVPWMRVVPIALWLTDLSSHSWVAAMDPSPRAALFDRLRAILESAFPDGDVRAPHATSLWIATKN